VGRKNSLQVCEAGCSLASSFLSSGGGNSSLSGSRVICQNPVQHSRHQRLTSSHSAHEGASCPLMGWMRCVPLWTWKYLRIGL